jgi:hypothetical protein
LTTLSRRDSGLTLLHALTGRTGKPYGAVLSIDHHEPSAPFVLAKRPPNVVKKRQKTG